MKHKHMCFATIPKYSKEEVNEVPTKVVDMLGEFSDIVSDNLLDVFPLTRKINHQMDLVLEANFPYKETHKITPVESKELNRQVHDFL